MPPRKAKTKAANAEPVTVTLSPDKLEVLEATKSASKDALQSFLIFQSWTIDKSPGLKRMILPSSSTKPRKIACPRGYRSREYDLVGVPVGADLNAIVHKYYNITLTKAIKEEALQNDKAHRKRVDKSGSSEMDGWVNGGGWNITYVAGEGVTQKRHEYLGPAPMVAGYRNLNNPKQDIQILWYDNFLQDRWCEKETWDIDVEISVDAKGEAEWTMLQS
ncbi:hypothetical protein FRB94_012565 [Tulasnella sp. JGI-2019a]|nr:hypothetical protein FRB93_001471 [Tulasnella sp. JGI-2019a]KAG9009042.1 hypothetical protein FRB94_012565 [Tulasnella sp. JGI-2019a]KAG9026252.1 hypothetical protein FRB95_009052 [Tulasnella sp. JGI-2019a]